MHEPTDPEMTAFETQLRGLRPSSHIDREALMFRAGRASAARSWAWQLATVCSTVVAGILGIGLLVSPPRHVVERHVYLPEPPAPKLPDAPAPGNSPGAAVAQSPQASQPSTQQDDRMPDNQASEPTQDSALILYQSRLRLRDHLLHWGLDGLPVRSEPHWSEPAETPASLLRAQ
jgi:hypothetical protein